MDITQETLERRQAALVERFHGAPIAQTMGMRLHYDEADRAVFTMPYHADFDHGLGGIHGGVFATLIDNAGWFTAAPHFETWIVTIEFHVRLLEPVAKEALWSRGEIIRLGKRISVVEMEVRTQADRRVATGTGTFAPTKLSYPTSE